MRVRAVPLPHVANREKVEHLKEFIRVWRSALTMCKQEKIRHLRNGGKLHRFTKDMWRTGKPDFLSARQWKSVENQVDASLKSWQGQAVNAGRAVIASWVTEKDLSAAEAKDLYTLNKSRKWWDPVCGNPELIAEILRKCPFPVYARTFSAALDDIVAPLEQGKNTEHDWWLRVRTFHGTILDIPVHKNDYYLSRMDEGDECAVTTVTVTEAGNISLHRMVRTPKAAVREHGDALGIDWGVSTLIATSDGRLLGRKLYPWLQERDKEVTELAARLQRLGVTLKSSRRFRKLTRRIRAYVRNEVGRTLNTFSRDDIARLAVERLDFRGGGLSRRLNRIVSRAGRAAFREKLLDLEETHGVASVEVNPAYTSQTCHSCGFAYSGNRSRQSRMACTHCGRKVSADINASRNILRRSQDTDGLIFVHRSTVLASLDSEFERYWRIDPNRLRERRSRRASPGSTPMQSGCEQAPLRQHS